MLSGTEIASHLHLGGFQWSKGKTQWRSLLWPCSLSSTALSYVKKTVCAQGCTIATSASPSLQGFIFKLQNCSKLRLGPHSHHTSPFSFSSAKLILIELSNIVVCVREGDRFHGFMAFGLTYMDFSPWIDVRKYQSKRVKISGKHLSTCQSFTSGTPSSAGK